MTIREIDLRAAILTLVSLSFVCGCEHKCGRKQNFDGSIVLVNSSGHHIAWSEFKGVPELIPTGVLAEAGNKAQDIGPIVLPEVVTVFWEFDGGEQHSVVVPVRSVVPPDYHEDLVFEIMPDGTVQVTPDAKRAYLHRSAEK